MEFKIVYRFMPRSIQLPTVLKVSRRKVEAMLIFCPYLGQSNDFTVGFGLIWPVGALSLF